MEAWCRARCDECLQVGSRRSTFGSVGEHQGFESDVGSYRKPVEGKQKCAGVGRLKTSHCSEFQDLVHGADLI